MMAPGQARDNRFAQQLIFQTIFFIYLLLLFFFGMTVCGFCLRAHDICFLLAMGRFIVEHNSLPISDPFSWTYAVYPNNYPFVVHQWLTDILFYLAVKAFSASSLVLITAIAVCLAFLVIPLKIMSQLRLNYIQSFVLVCISLLAACSHLQARPEIFSYIFISLYYLIMIKADQNSNLSYWDLIFLFAAMILWCNLHSGFVAGIAMLCFWLLFSIIDQILFKKNTTISRYLAAVILCFVATLINPFGFKLWQYLPSLYCSPISHYICEWRHFDLDFFRYAIFYPLLFLIIIFIFLAYKITKKGALKKSGLKPLALGFVSIIGGLWASRFMNIASLSLIIAIGMLLSSLKEQTNSQNKFLAVSFINPHSLLFGFFSTVLVVASAAFFTAEVMPAEIPEGFGDPIPSAAIEYLKGKPQSGRLLNDPQYGDVMVWRLYPSPKIFIDSRFDLYDPSMVDKYFKLVDCKPGWQPYLRSFNIDWLFLPINCRLVRNLHQQPEWVTLYADQAAVIMRKRN